MVKQEVERPVSEPVSNGSHVPPHVGNGVASAAGPEVVIDGVVIPHTRSAGLKGLAEEAILNPQSVAYNNLLKVILVAILTSIVILALETMHPLVEDWEKEFHAVDLALLAIFTFEYGVNVWVQPKRWAYIFSLWGIVDFLAIFPAYIELAFGGVESLIFLRQLRILRVMRMLKLLKLAAEKASQSASQATEKKSTFLMDIQIYAICLFTVLTISSSLLYQFEGVAPGVPELTGDALTALKEVEEKGTAAPTWADDGMVKLYAERAERSWSNPVYTFTSVPKAYWWSIVTLTTTGYGDMFPVTVGGRIVAGGTMLAGLGLFSLLTSVVGRALMTTLFGSGDDDSPTNRIVVIGGSRLPSGTDIRALVGLEPVTDTGTKSRGALENVLMEGDLKLSDIAHSVSEAANSVVRAAAEGAVRQGEAIHRENAGAVDRFIYAAFADTASRFFMPMQQFLTALIFASVVLVVADSIKEVHEAYYTWFEVIEKIIVLCFTVEFVANYRLAPKKLAYVFSMWGMVDVLAILPTYIDLGVSLLAALGVQMEVGGGLLFKVLRMMRVLRMLRTLKLAKSAAANMEKSMSKKGGSSFSTNLQIYFIALFTVLVISSTLMWNVEYDPTDEASTTMFTNIPAAMWWGIVTLCTVGYGDMFPVTFAGRAIAGITMLCGLALFGILTSVIGTALMASLFGATDDSEPEIMYLDGSSDDPAPVLGDLERLVALRNAGALSADDFDRAKELVLTGR